MLIASLFTTAELWNQPRCPTSEEWINSMVWMHSGLFQTEIRKRLLFAGKMGMTEDNHIK